MPATNTHSVTRTVLLADDSPTIQRVVELSFAGENVRVVAVGDGGAAITAIRKARPDVVLADIGMPGASGYDVLAFVRSQPSLADVPVLLLAGAFEQVDEAEVARKGADGVLSKPFDPAALVGRVGELLSRGRAAAIPLPPKPAAPPSQAARPAPEPPRVATVAERDKYFEEIDQAFAALTKVPRPPVIPADADEASDDAISPPIPTPVPQSQPRADTAGPVELDPSSVPFSDAFAALLDAERTGTPVDALWKPAQNAPAAAGVDIERLADLVARRVLEQLSDRTVRETVSDIVSTTAERLVREEIDRIKRHIK